MPTPSVKRALPQIAGTDSPDVPRDINALIAALEAEVGYLTQRNVLEIGQVGQGRAGRQLAAADFTDLGLAVPIGLYNLHGAVWLEQDNSGNGRTLTNKGGVVSAPGVEGVTGSAALFAGSTAQALYRADTGAADPFRIRVGSAGCWFKCSRRAGGAGTLMSKYSSALRSFIFSINGPTNTLYVDIGTNGTANVEASAVGTTDVVDDRWHFGVFTYDGTQLRLFLDGQLEASTSWSGGMNFGANPLNIGAYGADAATAAGGPFYGKIDEAFITGDVLSEEQVRLLMALKLPHGAPRTPRRAGVTVRRRRRGAALAVADFPGTPLRLYNGGGAAGTGLTDLGSNATNLGDIGAIKMAGPDGLTAGSDFFGTTGHTGYSGSDAGLPAGTNPVTMGIWLKTTHRPGVNMTVMAYGTGQGGRRLIIQGSGFPFTWDGAAGTDGPDIRDGQWHHVVGVWEPSASDGVRQRCFLDGRMVGTQAAALTAVTLGGAGKFRIGADANGTEPFSGNLARAFVYNGALTPEQIQTLYQKSSQDLGLSPVDAGAVVERIDATNIYALALDLEPEHAINLEVAA